MKDRAIEPTAAARGALVKAMPPGPSEPASIPSRRKRSRAGTPKRLDSFPAKTPKSRRTATTRIGSNEGT